MEKSNLIPQRQGNWFAIIQKKLPSPRIEKYARQYALLMATIILGLGLVLLARCYDYTDDLLIRDYTRSDVPIVYSGYLLDAALSALNKYVSLNFPWYGVSLYAIQFILLTILCYLVVTKNAPWWYLLGVGGLLLSMYLLFVMRLSYNYSSILAGGLSVLAFFDSLVVKKRPNCKRVVLLGIILALSFTFRRDGIKVAYFYVIPPVFALLGFLVILRKVFFLRTAGFLCLFLLPLIVTYAYDDYYFSHNLSAEEQFHRTVNRARGAYFFMGYSESVRENPRLLRANGWTRNDVYIIDYAMGMFDENKFTGENYRRIFEDGIGLTEEQGKKSILYNLTHFGQVKGFLWYDASFNTYWPYFVVMIIFVVIALLGGRTYYDKLFPLGLLIYHYFVDVYMVNYQRLPFHVVVPTFVLYALMVFVCVDFSIINGFTRPIRKVFWAIIAIAILFLSIFFVRDLIDIRGEILEKREDLISIHNDLIKRLGDDAFIFIRPQLYLEFYADPLALGNQGPNTNYGALGLSSGAYSPLFYKHLEQFNLRYGYQVLPWMVDNPKAYFVSKSPAMMGWVQRFVYETYGLLIKIEPYYTYPTGLTIYRFRSQYKSVTRYREVYNFIDYIDEARINASSPDFVRRSIFHNPNPREVLFEHPQSDITYQLKIPQSARLRFAISLSREVWDAEGDGVQFDIYIEDEKEIAHPFSEYIDPKENPEDRIWYDHEINLDRWAGQTVSITFQTRSGPNNDNRYDWAGWGDPRIIQYVYYDFIQSFYQARPLPNSLLNERVIRIPVDKMYLDAIYQHPNGWLSYPVHIKPGTLMDFGVGLDPGAWDADGDGVQFLVIVTDQDGQQYLIYSQYIDPKTLAMDKQWHFESLDLSRYQNQDVLITFVTNPGPWNDSRFDWAYWINPRLTVASRE